MTGPQVFIAIAGPLFLLSIIPMVMSIYLDADERFWPFTIYFGLVIHFANGAAIQFGYGAFSIPITLAIVAIWAVASFAPLRCRLAGITGPILEFTVEQFYRSTDWIDGKLYRTRQMRAARREVNDRNRCASNPQTDPQPEGSLPPRPLPPQPSRPRSDIDDIFD